MTTRQPQNCRWALVNGIIVTHTPDKHIHPKYEFPMGIRPHLTISKLADVRTGEQKP